jgi:hypothetical protein
MIGGELVDQAVQMRERTFPRRVDEVLSV